METERIICRSGTIADIPPMPALWQMLYFQPPSEYGREREAISRKPKKKRKKKAAKIPLEQMTCRRCNARRVVQPGGRVLPYCLDHQREYQRKKQREFRAVHGRSSRAGER